MLEILLTFSWIESSFSRGTMGCFSSSEKVSFLFQGTLNQYFLWVLDKKWLKSQGHLWHLVAYLSLFLQNRQTNKQKHWYFYFLMFWGAPQRTINKVLITVDPPRERFHIYLPIHTIQGTLPYHRNSCENSKKWKI